MRKLMLLVLLAGVAAFAQQRPIADGQEPTLKSRADLPAGQGTAVPADDPAPAKPPAAAAKWVVPAGTRIPVQLRQPISTKSAHPGDPVYGQTNFPIVVGENVMIPAGTYVQGVIDNVKRAGRIKGTAELQLHLTTLLYPNGYTVNLAAAVDQVPGSDSSHMKEPGTIQHDSEKGTDMERIGRDAATGATIGGVAGAASGNVRGIGIGGLSGIAAGTLIGVLARGSDVRFESGTAINVVLNRAIALDPRKIRRGRMAYQSGDPEPPSRTPPPDPQSVP